MVTALQHERIRELFDAVVAMDDAQRHEYLDSRCGDDDGVRAEVEALIRSHARGTEFLERPAVLLASNIEAEESQPDLSGQRIGRYLLQGIIASGGMGIVYEAVQDEPTRAVALKVMRRGLTSRSALRRFQYEAQVLGRLRHPNIAQIYEAATHSTDSVRDGGEPIPYFAMELIENSRSITDYVREEGLSIRERVALYVKVCDAIHHGHQKGVVHRDIKPANILVDPKGEPKVIDFGVARMTDSDLTLTTLATQIGQLVGTVQYMSPEQCEGDPEDVDIRSDVYSLGAVLYELLCGAPAHDTTGSSVVQATRMIRETSPRALSSIDRRLRGDIETIVVKAMEIAPERRYESADALKRDLERFLAGEPIEARRRSGWTVVMRWINRHPTITTGVATALIVTVLTICVSYLMLLVSLGQPARIRVADDAEVAYLVDKVGRTLATFGSRRSQRYMLQVMLVDRPKQFGGGKVVLFKVGEGELSTEQQLWVATPDNLNHPRWKTTPEIPQSMPAIPAAWGLPDEERGFVVTRFDVCDVYPDLPGDEIITVQEQIGGSPNVVRVWDFGGTMLFEAWHLGHIKFVIWWSEAQLLAVGGDRHGKPDNRRLGYEDACYPKVVFTLRPTRGPHAGWINERDWPTEWQNPGADLSEVAWYKVLAPIDYTAPSQMTHIEPFFGDVDSSVPGLSVGFRCDDLSMFTLRIDERGEEVRLYGNDKFDLNRSELPAEDPTLVDWPPSAPIEPGRQ